MIKLNHGKWIIDSDNINGTKWVIKSDKLTLPNTNQHTDQNYKRKMSFKEEIKIIATKRIVGGIKINECIMN